MRYLMETDFMKFLKFTNTNLDLVIDYGQGRCHVSSQIEKLMNLIFRSGAIKSTEIVVFKFRYYH